ncbi:kinesin-domain-containing protein [Laetiporus sulphureus 93-53]|uniref:Kinesin-like protein n=1 Tax=Laetiporus sulphureus 93-53 TaxID=1314785 RepID=A0A165E5V5_9APHY|nr:kinesin-domain-containing protein [Laetiporus sulphureus 93-53]KZT06295.1 kinesin-domain-containing protein [Laetiporus sulphureus 93-53]
MATTRSSARSKATTAPTAPAGRATRSTNVGGRAQSTTTKATAKKATNRKPLVSRANSMDTGVDSEAHPGSSQQSSTMNVSAIPCSSDMEREPIKAFLRIRPQLGDGPTSEPYLHTISDTAVRMSDPSSQLQSSSRLSSLNPSSIYTFSHIFPPDSQQSQFFNRTTLPLVQDLLEGQNGLLFAYGVTNSGKTYTVQGGSDRGSAGILPRTLDVIFNSIEGRHGDGQFRPVRLNGIEAADDEFEDVSPHNASGGRRPSLIDILDDALDIREDIDPTVLKLDRNYEYTIWLSYSEIYNEKVYDLFSSVDPSEHSPQSGSRPMSTFLNMPLPSSQSNPLLLSRKALALKSCPPSDSGLSADDVGLAGKYVTGLRQIRVHSAAQAKELLRLGQLHRRVFGTLANSQSSRSHAIVTIKVLRVHRGERNDPSSIQTSRLTMVDLAGSERTKYTQSSGDRLREAGNINKSLMVLGQCMETLRANQRAVARSLATHGGRIDTRDVKKGLAVVPFRHSKLTEVLMDYFIGDGRAVMILNVNPYDTGYDENSHVMKFAALAREVCTVAPTATSRPLPVLKDKPERPQSSREIAPHRRKVTISTRSTGHKASEAHLEVLEEDEEQDEDDEGEIDPVVEALFDEVEQLRAQLHEAEMRCALIEAETREEVMEEMEERMRSMEKMFERRLRREAENHEKKMDAKIDMMARSGLHRPAPPADVVYPSLQLSDDEAENFVDELAELASDGSSDSEEHASTASSTSPSPLARKSVKPLSKAQSQPSQGSNGNLRGASPSSSQENAVRSSDSAGHDGLVPMRKQLLNRQIASLQNRDFSAAPSPVFEADVKAGKMAARLAKSGDNKLPSLERNLMQLSLQEKPRESTIIVPDKVARQEAVANGGDDVEYVPLRGEVDPGKKKKRQLGKSRVINEEGMADIVLTSSQESTRQLRARH